MSFWEWIVVIVVGLIVLATVGYGIAAFFIVWMVRDTHKNIFKDWKNNG